VVFISAKLFLGKKNARAWNTDFLLHNSISRILDVEQRATYSAVAWQVAFRSVKTYAHCTQRHNCNSSMLMS